MTAIQKYALEFDSEQRALILKTFFNGATEQEAAPLLEVARIRGLNPLLQEVHFVKRAGTWAVQIGIDGARKLVHKTGELNGISSMVYDDANGKPLKAIATVRRKGCEQPFEFEAYLSEYTQNNAMWQRMPRRMIAKCAEMGALRMAFADAIGGLYEQDEPIWADEAAPKPSPQQVTAQIKSRVSERAAAVRAKETPPERPAELPAPPQSTALEEAHQVAVKVAAKVGGTIEMPRRTTGVTYPFGRDKGRDLADVGEESLIFWLTKCQEQLDDPSKARYRASTQGNISAIKAELALRNRPESQAPVELPPESQMPTEISAEDIPF